MIGKNVTQILSKRSIAKGVETGPWLTVHDFFDGGSCFPPFLRFVNHYVGVGKVVGQGTEEYHVWKLDIETMCGVRMNNAA
jgi:hypothetical protein